MSAGALIPRNGSSSNINGLSQWQTFGFPSATAPNGRKHGKAMGSQLQLHGHLARERERSCLRLQRIVTGRRVGMFVAVLISCISLLMLINVGGHVSLHFNSVKDTEAPLEVVTKLQNNTRTEDVNARGTNMTTRFQEISERSVIKGESTIEMQHASSGLHVSTFEDRGRLPWPLVSSDQPLPHGHPCQGFTLPPPPADKKRTGPRPCPVCYLPIEKAIEQMPGVNASTSPVIKNLSYVVKLPTFQPTEMHEGSEFGGHPSLEERNKSFQIRESMNVHCGFVKGSQPGAGTGFDINEEDRLDMDRCTGVVVASAIFGNYDQLQQPKNISPESRKTVCFFMFVDEETQESLGGVSSDRKNGLWRVVVVHYLPYSDSRRNGKIPKLLLHRLFPNSRFSLWIDGKLELIVDPYQVLERFLWRGNQIFAISQHYKRLDVFNEAEANKAAGKYNNASIDAQIDFYHNEGLQHYDTSKSSFPSDVPEGCVIIREHTPITNLFTCLWFNEVDRFTSRDQLSFAIVRDKLLAVTPWRLSMFLDCERRNFVVQTYHRELLEQRKTSQVFLNSGMHTNGTSQSHIDLPVGSPPNRFATTLPIRHTPNSLSRKASGRNRRGAGTKQKLGSRATSSRHA